MSLTDNTIVKKTSYKLSAAQLKQILAKEFKIDVNRLDVEFRTDNPYRVVDVYSVEVSISEPHILDLKEKQ